MSCTSSMQVQAVLYFVFYRFLFLNPSCLMCWHFVHFVSPLKLILSTACINPILYLHLSLSCCSNSENLYGMQIIVEKAENGDTDHIKHALDLFVDFAAIFVRILVIMLQNAEKREERRDSRKRRN